MNFNPRTTNQDALVKNMEISKKTFKIKYHIFQYNVIVNTLMNSNNKKFKDHLHNFFNKTNVMYKWPTKSVFVQWARKLQ